MIPQILKAHGSSLILFSLLLYDLDPGYPVTVDLFYSLFLCVLPISVPRILYLPVISLQSLSPAAYTKFRILLSA